MKKILESVLSKIIITSIIMSTISGVIVYKVTETKYENKITLLNKDINKMKNDMKKLTEKKENKKDEENLLEDSKKELKEDGNNKTSTKTEINKTSNPNVEIKKFSGILVEASNEAEWYCETNPYNEGMGLNGTIMIFKEYANSINNVINTVDFSVIGGDETKASLVNISNMLMNFKNSDNYTVNSENIAGYIGEFLYQLEYYMK